MKINFKNVIGNFYGVITLICLVITTTLCFVPIFFLGLLKLIPNRRWSIFCTKGIDRMCVLWTGIIAAYVKQFYPTKWNISGDVSLDSQQWYLVIANHQSWLDIVILQHIFHRKIPVLKFFVKEQLKWLPLFGFAWWAMGCPFMKRYSKEYLDKNPHKKNLDTQSTYKSLKLFRSYPSSIMSFIEGTRFTSQKKQHQNSPYQHLLKPKAGGISLMIGAMKNQLQPIVDATIVYPHAHHSLWDFLTHRIKSVEIHLLSIPIPEVFTDPAVSLEEKAMQDQFRSWLNEQWAMKDVLISELKQKA